MKELAHILVVGVEAHFGLLCFTLFGVWLTILYAKGEAMGFFSFLKDALSANGEPSNQRIGFFVAVVVISWSYVKVTMAICEQIRSGKLDGTTIQLAILGVLAALVTTGTIGSKLIGAMASKAEETPK